MNIDSIIRENKHLNIFGYNAEKDCLLAIDKKSSKVFYFYDFVDVTHSTKFDDLPNDTHIRGSFTDLIGCAMACGYIYRTTNECDKLKFDYVEN